MTDPNHVLHYAQPAAEWCQALPVGNGRLGGMVWGGTRLERISLNEETVWSGSPNSPARVSSRDHLRTIQNLIWSGQYADADALTNEEFMGEPRSMACYQPVGEAILEMKAIDGFRIHDYRRELNLDTAIASTSFRTKDHTHRRKVLVLPERNVMVVRLECDTPGQISFNLTANSPQNATLRVVDDSLELDGRCSMENGMSGAIRFQARFQVTSESGGVEGAEDHLQIRGADSATVLISIATSFVAYNDVSGNHRAITKETIHNSLHIPYAELESGAVASHRLLYRRIQLDLGLSKNSRLSTDDRLDSFRAGAVDPSLCALYHNYGRYLLIASSRNCRQPGNLQGIWNECLRPNWQSKFTININTQMNYWPAEPANLPETVESLIQLVRDLAVTGRHTAAAMYGAGGWVTHHNTDIWRSTAPIDLPMYGQWPLAGAWLCKHLWDRYDYGREIDYLRSIYPVLSQACVFYLDTLRADPKTGYLVMSPSMSPENAHQHGTALCAGSTVDSQLLRDLFTWTLEAGRLVEEGQASDNDSFARQLSEARAGLCPTEIGAGGQVKEWQEDWDDLVPDTHHRHTSHLYALYPSAQIDVHHSPELAEACRVTLANRGEAGTGWAAAWRMNLWARLGDSERAYDMCKWLLSRSMCYYNLFDAHPPLDKTSVSVFQIDGNLGGSAGILEMLVQSTKSSISILPALPRAWPRGSLHGIRVRGGWEINLVWSESSLARVTLTAVLSGGRQQVIYRGGVLETTLETGHSVEYTPLDFR